MRRATSNYGYFWIGTVLSVACIELNSEPPDDGADGGRSGAGAGGTRTGGNAGRAASGGAAGSISAGGTHQTGTGGRDEPFAGSNGTSAAGGRDHPEGGSVGNSGSAGEGAGTSNSGGSGGAGAGTAGSGVGGKSGSGGTGGSGASGGTDPGGAGTINGSGGFDGDDRCDVAVLDVQDPPELLALSGSLGVHDPTVIEADGTFYLFHTGGGLPVKTSSDLLYWEKAGSVFASNPSWIASQVPAATDLWAPDISYFGGKYHVYYSASTFGSRSSCIGHATRDAIDAGSWSDRGPVVCSNPGGGSTDDWNAIDPNLILDRDGDAYLTFGSFWGGIKMIELDANGDRANSALHSLAARQTAGGSIEAPYIVRRCGYYYLFVSFDYCCRGSNSTYRTMVGRSTNLLGPYTDRAGTPMLEGGGTQLVQGGARFRGPGHNAVLFSEEAAYNVYHAYDSANSGASVLRIAELAWDENGWPVSAGP